MPRKYIPNEKEKYMCEKHKVYFKKKLVDWKNEIIELNSKGLYLKDVDHEISSPDVVDQAASQTEKNVEMRTLNRQIKLLSKIERAIKKINDNSNHIVYIFQYSILSILKDLDLIKNQINDNYKITSNLDIKDYSKLQDIIKIT